ncbi:hypothetical protein [Archaeoglobus sp.]
MLGEVEEVLKEFCEWSGRDRGEYIQQAVFERLKGDLEEIASYNIPRAKEMLGKLLEA